MKALIIFAILFACGCATSVINIEEPKKIDKQQIPEGVYNHLDDMAKLRTEKHNFLKDRFNECVSMSKQLVNFVENELK